MHQSPVTCKVRFVTNRKVPPSEWADHTNRLAREAITQGVKAVSERYEVSEDDVRDLVTAYRAALVRRRRMVAT